PTSFITSFSTSFVSCSFYQRSRPAPGFHLFTITPPSPFQAPLLVVRVSYRSENHIKIDLNNIQESAKIETVEFRFYRTLLLPFQEQQTNVAIRYNITPSLLQRN
ncbi:hypothetical protein LINPERPRIM_LOCUS16482, partial [Linum perenne]